ncbi:MAG: nucleotide exchange factor GrpE [bacterium]|nr:nucleotide exchange factor GrpE [bacterium]
MPDEHNPKQQDNEDDIKIESDDTLDDSVVAEESFQETVKKLRGKLKECEKERQEYLTGWQKSQADFVNLRKRDEEDKKNFIKFATGNVLADIIPVLDSFDMAMGNKEVWEKADKNWRMGVEYIYNQLVSSLQTHGLSIISPKAGDVFSPAEHDAVSSEKTEDKESDHKIASVSQKGYRLGDKVLRPAKVIIYDLSE